MGDVVYAILWANLGYTLTIGYQGSITIMYICKDILDYHRLQNLAQKMGEDGREEVLYDSAFCAVYAT